MRRLATLLSLVLVGCASEQEVASRVELPTGLQKPKDLRPDPAPRKDPSPAGQEIQQSPAPKMATDVTFPATAPGRQEVEGVCRYNEADVECWNTGAVPDVALSKLIKNSLAANRGQGALPMTFGQKNRLVVVLLPYEEKGDSSSVISEGSTIGANMMNNRKGEKTRQVIQISVPPKTASTSVRFLERKRLSDEATVSLQKGATVKIAGCLLTVDSIEKMGPADEYRFFVRNRPAWKIVIKPTGPRPKNEHFFPIDPYPMVRPDGQRVSMEALSKGKVVYAPKDFPQFQPIFYSGLPEGAVAVILDRDPKVVKTMKIGAEEQRNIEVTGIPLDPK